jgi:hypothetical protein
MDFARKSAGSLVGKERTAISNIHKSKIVRGEATQPHSPRSFLTHKIRDFLFRIPDPQNPLDRINRHSPQRYPRLSASQEHRLVAEIVDLRRLHKARIC